MRQKINPEEPVWASMDTARYRIKITPEIKPEWAPWQVAAWVLGRWSLSAFLFHLFFHGDFWASIIVGGFLGIYVTQFVAMVQEYVKKRRKG